MFVEASEVKKLALVIGWGISGKAAAHFLIKKGYAVFCFDDKVKEGPCVSFEQAVETEWEFGVVSPGILPSHPLYQALVKKGVTLISEVELACREWQMQPWVGVTGTNGKTTVTQMVHHFLLHAGKKARALGNIGIPLSLQEDFEEEEVIVAELSSYQLERTFTPALNAAVILNITPDHFEHHQTMENYAKAKLHIQNCLKDPNGFYLQEALLKEWPVKGANSFGQDSRSTLFSDGKKLFFHSKELGELPKSLQGSYTHHTENFLAATALTLHLGVSYHQIADAYPSFCRPPHRIQQVGRWEGITFVDDSKATNVDAVIRAVESLPGPLWVILGGVHKGSSYRPWISCFRGKVKGLLLVGEAAPLMLEELGEEFPCFCSQTIAQAIEDVKPHLKRGDTLLLSPGCASFDQFKNYSERGAHFQQLVANFFPSRYTQ